MAYILPVSGNMILIGVVAILALASSAADWIYNNMNIVTTIAMLVALGLTFYRTYKQSEEDVHPALAFFGGLISESSSMLYLLWCVWEIIEFVIEDSLFGLIPAVFTAPFIFGAWGIIKIPSLVATSEPSNTTAVCDGVITLALVLFAVWFFKKIGAV